VQANDGRNRKEVRKLFQPSLDGVARVMMEQMKKAREVGHSVQVRLYLLGKLGFVLKQRVESDTYWWIWTILYALGASKERTTTA
jgi:hypothetical protein